jgi:transcriptional regulator GlxA family with amidase domain
MLASRAQNTPLGLGFVLIPRFSMIALSGAVDALRLANRISGQDLYHTMLISTDGNPVRASNGTILVVDASIADVESISAVAVCGGLESHAYEDKKLVSWLRKLSRNGSSIGALCTASDLLARAGLLDGYRCTIHWENLASFAERFPNAEVTNELFEIDRDRFTCSGGTAAIDMILNMVAIQHGDELARQISDQLIHDRIRGPHDHQRMALRSRLAASHPKLLSVVSQMEEHLEEPLSCSELAEGIGLSTRHLERLFRKHFDLTPTRYYLELRLNRARLLLLQTSLSVLGVALACGFVSASHFTKCYRDTFGRTPREERRAAPTS